MSIEFNGMVPADFADTAGKAVAACDGKTLGEQAALLAADGLIGICAGEDTGGLGMPLAFALPVLMAGSKALMAFPLAEALLVASVLQTEVVVAGEKVATVAWQGAVTLDGDTASGAAGRAPFGAEADLILLKTQDGRGVLVSRDAAGVSTVPTVGRLDLVQPEVTVRLDRVTPEAVIAAETMAEFERVALLLKAASIIGSARFCIEAAQEHATTRRQFGKPLVANQAIRHHLARHKMALESATVLLERAVSANALPQSGRSAFAVAVQSGILIAEGAVQMHGGMGFTWEVPLHFHLRQIRATDMQLDAGGNLDRLAASYIDGLAPLRAAE